MILEVLRVSGHLLVLASQGDAGAARAEADAAIEAAAEPRVGLQGPGYGAFGLRSPCRLRCCVARDASEAWPQLSAVPSLRRSSASSVRSRRSRVGMWSRPAIWPTTR